VESSLNMVSHAAVERQDFDLLLEAIRARGYEIMGPRIRDRAIVYDEVRVSEDLPIGWTDEQDGGTYGLVRINEQSLFGYAVGPESWKKYLFPPRLSLWKARLDGDQVELTEPDPEPRRLAFLGIRSCELHAIFVQDRVFMGGKYVDPVYARQRENLFLIAVNCGHAGGTCFCVSMNTGPKADAGFDLALTELIEDGRHVFVVEAGSDEGAAVLASVPHSAARAEDVAAADGVVERTANSMGRSMDTTNIKDLLARNYEHPRWDDVASRCLTCTNCTMVCPTCFCSAVEDTTDLTGQESERVRRWDSCFTIDFSHIHGGSVRTSPKSRYRQWMTHKLGTWWDQFGTSGCVGCGRCISWCPVGIDITEEVAAIRASDGAPKKSEKENKNGNA
jgi:sulfhydrogenase subunit beta (sulfur reductase)